LLKKDAQYEGEFFSKDLSETVGADFSARKYSLNQILGLHRWGDD